MAFGWLGGCSNGFRGFGGLCVDLVWVGSAFDFWGCLIVAYVSLGCGISLLFCLRVSCCGFLIFVFML